MSSASLIRPFGAAYGNWSHVCSRNSTIDRSVTRFIMVTLLVIFSSHHFRLVCYPLSYCEPAAATTLLSCCFFVALLFFSFGSQTKLPSRLLKAPNDVLLRNDCRHSVSLFAALAFN